MLTVKTQRVLERENYLANISKLFLNYNFLLIIAITILYYGSIIASTAYSFNYSTQLVGWSITAFSIIGMLTIGSEFIFMNNYERIKKHFTYQRILIFAAIVTILRFFVFFYFVEVK